MKYRQHGNRIRNSRIPVARAGYPFIGISGLVTGGLALSGATAWAVPALVLTVFIVSFFRDPERKIPDEPGAVVAPADGRVVRVETVPKSPFYEAPCKKIGIFMSIFNVHVNRIPYEGRLRAIRYSKGAFMAADKDRASELNERNALLLETRSGKAISIVQVAGLIARRIVCVVRENEPVVRGQRFGLIRFGSRVDLYLPETTLIRVRAGERVRAGASIVGYLR